MSRYIHMYTCIKMQMHIHIRTQSLFILTERITWKKRKNFPINPILFYRQNRGTEIRALVHGIELVHENGLDVFIVSNTYVHMYTCYNLSERTSTWKCAIRRCIELHAYISHFRVSIQCCVSAPSLPPVKWFWGSKGVSNRIKKYQIEVVSFAFLMMHGLLLYA